jgi:hypothetical protein
MFGFASEEQGALKGMATVFFLFECAITDAPEVQGGSVSVGEACEHQLARGGLHPPDQGIDPLNVDDLGRLGVALQCYNEHSGI